MEEETAPGLTALIVGAHADDVEIAMGGTAARMVASGWRVWYCTATSEADPEVATTRKAEATQAAGALGIPPERVFFLDLLDAHVHVDGESVGMFRRRLSELPLDPDLVFTHTAADSHNDHLQVRGLVLATFRRKPILSFAVVNSLVKSEFTPRVFVEMSAYRQAKSTALTAYKSQGQRVNEKAIDNLCQGFSSERGLKLAEAFEVILQEGAEDLLYLALSLNDCPFHNFWYPLLREHPLAFIHSVPIYRKNRDWSWPSDREQKGIDLLHRAFASLWQGRHPLEGMSADSSRVEKTLHESSVLLIGSAASNQVTRNYLDRFEGLRYVVDYTMPDYRNLCIVDRRTSKRISATYQDDEFGVRRVAKDVGVLTVMANPMQPSRSLLAATGIHGSGTWACLKALCDGKLLSQLPTGSPGFQILVDVDARTEKVELRKKSLTHLV